jgi:large subunit ribosomal protein L31
MSIKSTECKVNCSCGHEFMIVSTKHEEAMSIEKCNKCHVAYTGKATQVKTGGRLDKFAAKYGGGATKKA